MRSPRSGALRQRLVLEAPERVETEGGAATVTWAEVAALWAEVRPVSGREIVLADAVKARVTHEVSIRYRTGLRPEMRFAGPGARVLEIRSVLDLDERRRWLICQCEERLP